jgi:hypothetical protein
VPPGHGAVPAAVGLAGHPVIRGAAVWAAESGARGGLARWEARAHAVGLTTSIGLHSGQRSSVSTFGGSYWPDHFSQWPQSKMIHQERMARRLTTARMVLMRAAPMGRAGMASNGLA